MVIESKCDVYVNFQMQRKEMQMIPEKKNQKTRDLHSQFAKQDYARLCKILENPLRRG